MKQAPLPGRLFFFNKIKAKKDLNTFLEKTIFKGKLKLTIV